MVNNFVKFIKRIEYSGLMGVLFGIALTVLTLNLYVQSNAIYMVKVSGKELGYVKGIDEVNKAVERIKQTDGKYVLKDVQIDKCKDGSRKTLTSQEIETRLRKELKLKIPAYIVRVGDVQVAVLASKNDYELLVETLKKRYIPKYDKTISVEINSFKIDENINFTVQYVDAILVEDVDEVAEKIIKGKLVEQTYIVKEGDTIWEISSKFGLSIDQITTYNPKLDLNKIKPGQEIKIVKNEPYFNVEMDLNVVTNEEVPYEVKEVYDKTINKGKQVVKEYGSNGLAEVTKNIKVVNGNVVDETLIASKLIKEPKNKVVVIGTKQSNIVASGMFIRPSRGYISSHFGRRWGRMHEGVDIAAPTGTPIHAADAGRVVFAGWMSGYGKCIMIDHGNGYRTVYGHASKLYVSAGTRVSKGQLIAAVGSTGRSTGPHLHFEIRKNGVPQNPIKYIK